MKQFTKYIYLVLAVSIFACTPEKISEPLAYSFADVFVNYKQPAITPSNGTLTDFTLAQVNDSKSNTEALVAIANGLAMTAGMEKSISNLQGSINANVFAELEAGFKASEITAISNGQPLSASIRKNIDLLLNSGYIDGFKSEIVMPTLDGKLAENFKILKSEYVQSLGASNLTAAKEPRDKCNENVNIAVNASKQEIDTDKVNAEKAVLNTYEVAVDKAAKQYDADKILTKNRFKADRDKASSNFNNIKAQINNNKNLSQAQKNAAIAVQIALLNDQIAKLMAAEKAQEIADTLKKDADISNAAKARDTDLEKINVKYGIELGKIETMGRVAKNKCHNQGGNK